MQLALLLLKRHFLDSRAEDADYWQVEDAHVVALKDQITQSLNFQAQDTITLKLKAEVICKCQNRLNGLKALINDLATLLKWTEGPPEELLKRKQFALYSFEVLSEYHLSQDILTEYSDNFLELFTSTLQEEQVAIKVAAVKAISCFLSSIDNGQVVMKYKGMISGLLDVVIEVMKQEEGKGQASLESLIDLTGMHGDIWNGNIPKLVYVVSEIQKNR